MQKMRKCAGNIPFDSNLCSLKPYRGNQGTKYTHQHEIIDNIQNQGA